MKPKLLWHGEVAVGSKRPDHYRVWLLKLNHPVTHDPADAMVVEQRDRNALGEPIWFRWGPDHADEFERLTRSIILSLVDAYGDDKEVFWSGSEGDVHYRVIAGASWVWVEQQEEDMAGDTQWNGVESRVNDQVATRALIEKCLEAADGDGSCNP